MTDLSFDDLRWLHLLWVALGVAGVGVYGLWQRRRALRMFGDPRLVRLGGGGRVASAGVGWGRPLARLGLIVAALVFLVAAIIGPRWGELEQTVVKRGIDVMVLLDVSRSMLARDLVPNRLERAKLAIRDDLLPALGGDRIGLIAFAGSASLKCPLTNDYGFFRLALDDVDTTSVPRGGTLIGDAIREAQRSFHDVGDTYKLVILITDGEDQESYPVEAARALWEDARVPIVSIVLGDDREGARIPLPSGAGEDYLTYKGEIVRSRARFQDLEEIARISPLHGLVRAGTKAFDLGELFRDTIARNVIEKSREEREKVRRPSQYWIFAVAALALVLIDSFLRDGPARATAAAAAGTSPARRGQAA